MKYNAREVEWIRMDINGVDGYFTDLRIDWGSVPENIHGYELADRSSDGIPCRYRSKEIGILVDFFGTFLTKDELPMHEVEPRITGSVINSSSYNKSIGYVSPSDNFGYRDGYISFDKVLQEMGMKYDRSRN